MPYTYFRKKIFRKYVLIFYVFLYDWKAVLFIFCIRISFSGRSLLTGLFVASPRYPPGFFPAIPNALRSGYAGREV